jgi:PKD repeat protein
MSYNIPMVTQDEIEEKSRPIQAATMATPNLAATLDPQMPEKKMVQTNFWGQKLEVKPTKVSTVKSYVTKAGNTVKGYVRITEDKSHGKKKKTKTVKSNKTGKQAKHCAYPKDPNDNKASVKLANSLHIQEQLNRCRNKY